MENIKIGGRPVAEQSAERDESAESEHASSNAETGASAEPRLREETNAHAETSLRDRTVYLLAGFLAIGFSFWWTQFSTRSICCGDFDGYYHFRWSRMLYEGLRAGDFPPAFNALPFTTLNPKDYVDHHFLFHMMQAPFTWLGDVAPAAWVLLAVCFLLSPLVYLRARRLTENGHGLLVAWLTSAAAGLVVAASLVRTTGGGDATRLIVSSLVPVASIVLCLWLTTRLLRRERGAWVAALAAFTFALLVPMLFFRASLFYQERAAEFFAEDPYAGFQYGAKVGTWLFATLAVLSCFWLIVRYSVRYPVFWLFALLGCSTPFLFRMNMSKAMSVSIVLLVAGLHLLFQRKYLWLLPLAYVFALTYDMVFLLWVASFIWLCATVWEEDWDVFSKKVRWAAAGFLFVLAGTALGFVINPYFPHNVVLMYQHMAMKITPTDFKVAVGGEWYPYNTWEFVWNSFIACVSMLVGYILFDFRNADRKTTTRTLFFLLFATFLMLVNMRWKRFSEYWPPFAVLFAAFALQPYLQRIEPRVTEARGRLSRWLRGRRLEYGMVSAAALIVAASAVASAHFAARDINGMFGSRHYIGGMNWIKENVPEGETIFNTDWDAFPKIFFYSPDHRYVSGLDPTYLLDQDKGLFDVYSKILGDPPDAGPLIREHFGARYVFTHNDRAQNMLKTGWFEQVYSDADAAVLRVLEEKIERDDEATEESEEETAEKKTERVWSKWMRLTGRAAR